ncbi:hypothetical protein [Butyrivibrio sp. YAB3001]|uniref:hypothetical protein n=1 Tax=Butyrivibrio sp. YAB3001 TaxID=1520812 RepID=UPI0008F62012|nr:hypothetical protein [Butyrivibrio sp. YAB3001]SFC57057.1 hypothetical protein SAMN02910398_02601 [Butyrivibrio sp. YAB3001]
MEDKKHRSLYQICNEAVDKREDFNLSAHKCSEYFLDMADAVGFDVNLLKSGTSKNSGMKIHEDDAGFVIDMLKDYGSCEEYLNLRKGKYEDVPMDVREKLLFGFCDMLRRSGASPDVINETWRKMRLTMQMDLQPIVERFNNQISLLAGLKDELLDDVSFANEDRDVLLSYYSSQIANLIADLKHIKNLFCSIREKEMDDIIQLETLEEDPDKRNSIKGIRLIKEIRNDEDYLFAIKRRKQVMERGGQISKKRKELEELNAQIDAIGRK